jgi:hypothetical protein
VISQEIAQKAVGIIGGHPFYLQLLGETLMQDLRAPTEVDLKDALQSLLFSPYGRLALFFENEMQRLVGRSTFLAATLDALANGPMTLTEVASRIRTSTGATVGYLERLKDAVTRTADERYALADPTFALCEHGQSNRWRPSLILSTVREGRPPISVREREASKPRGRALAAVAPSETGSRLQLRAAN